METVTYTNRWLLNPAHIPLYSAVRRNSRRHKAIRFCLSGFVLSLRNFSSGDFRLPSPAWFGKQSLLFRSDRVLTALPEEKFRCPENSDERLFGQRPCKGVSRNRKKFLFDDCRYICERICRIVSLEDSLTVVRKLFCLNALADTFSQFVKVSRRKLEGKMKSIPIIIFHNLLF
jgi:hypothetical protein